MISNIGQSIFQRLINRAKSTGEDPNHILARYATERFLYRLSISKYADMFVLKGASLFLVWKGQNYRVTRDADLLGLGDPSENKLMRVFKVICNEQCLDDDGVVYLPDSIKMETIKEDDRYQGVRIKIMGLLNQARLSVQVDVGFGDSVTPAPEMITYPTLLNTPAPKMKAYPRYTLVAEKFEAMVQLRLANSRMKDFFDIWMVSKLFSFESEILQQAISNTFQRRNTPLPNETPFAFTADFYEDSQKQLQWNAFVRKAKLNESVGNLSFVINEVSRFLSPIVTDLNSINTPNRVWLFQDGWH